MKPLIPYMCSLKFCYERWTHLKPDASFCHLFYVELQCIVFNFLYLTPVHLDLVAKSGFIC